VLAGGAGRRLGRVDKPGLLHHGRRLVDIALSAVEPALTVVVGPGRVLPAGILQAREDPPGGGPAAGLLAGLTALRDYLGVPCPGPDDLVVVLASDLPGINRRDIQSLHEAIRRDGIDGAVLTDPGGRPQYLAGVWRWRALLDSAERRTCWHNGRLSDLLAPLIGAVVPVDEVASADVDRPEDVVRWRLQAPASHPPDDGS
jgi:molybdopterin-guanine dinucleotide biosynthesis protein A